MRQLKVILTDAFASRRATLWYAACAAAVGAVLLKEISLLLGSFQPSVGGQAYSASVLTRWRVNPITGAEDIEAAWTVWTGSSPGWGLGRGLVALHTAVDLLMFIPGYAVLGYVLLRHVGTAHRPAVVVIGVLAVADAVETVVTFVMLPLLDRSELARVIAVLSDLKWLAALFVGLVLLFRWLIPDVGADVRAAGRRLRTRWNGLPPPPPAPTTPPAPAAAGAAGPPAPPGDQPPARPGPLLRLRLQVLLVAGFAALVALPAGGPLDQVPDVLRSHLEDLSLSRWVELAPSVLALGVFMGAVVVSGWRGNLLDLTAGGQRRAALSPRGLGGLALLAGAAGAILAVVFGGFTAASLALAVVLAVAALVPWLGVKLAGWSLVSEPPAPPVDDPEDVPTSAERDRLRTWLGALAGVIALAGSLGLIRATFRPVVVSGDLRVWLAVALLLAFLGPPALHSLACSRWLTADLIGLLGRVALPAAVIALVLLALWPRVLGRGLGSTGTVAVVFACAGVLLGAAQRYEERTRAWDAVRWLRLGRRSPLVGVVIVAWLLASVWDTEGGYHDARVLDQAHQATYRSIEDAWTAWRDSAPSCELSEGGQRVRPLLLVAAPGGGVRAAYWTASALDRLAAACPGSVFAVSGVSGGSVGTMAWTYGRAAGASPVPGRDLVGTIAGDDALAAGVTALLTRDLPRSLFALRGGIADRAAVTEQAWASGLGSRTGRAGDGELSFDQLTARRGQDPVMVFNGSSATDGCRVLMSNVDNLATAAGWCQGLPPDGQPGPAVSAAVTATQGLLTGKPGLAAHCTGGTASLRATTAALLSARFPVVSPSGALRRCVDGKVTPTYVLDGGYYENSGLLSLLQIWEGLQSSVQTNNATAGAVRIQPWVVVLDNHYRGTAGPAPVKRAPELRMPLIGNGNAKQTISTAALEQVAATEMGGCLRHVAPRAEPDVAAPLGWVLSATAREQLDEQLPAALGQPDPAARPSWLNAPGCTG